VKEKTRKKSSVVLAAAVVTFMMMAPAIAGPSSLPLAQSGAASQDSASALLARFPAANAADKDAACAEIVKAGPAAIEKICRLVMPAGKGDDASARFAIDGLSAYVMRPGAGKERGMFVAALLRALDAPADPEVKSFLISQVQLAGDARAAKRLARFLADDGLVDPAVRAILALRSPDTAKIFVKSLSRASVPAKIALLNALGELGSPEAVKALLPYSDSPDVKTRQTALYALAKTGNTLAGPGLAKTRVAASAYERSQAPGLYLLYARRLAENGKPAEGLAVARDLLAHYSGPGESHVASNALALVVSVLKDRSLPDLLAAAGTPDREFRGAALELASSIPGGEATKKWLEKASSASPEARADIIAMLGRRKDTAALPTVTAALKDADKGVRLEAIPAAARLGGEAVLTDIFGFMNSSDPDEVAAAKQAILGFRAAAVVPNSVELINSSTPIGQAALLDVLGEKCAPGSIDSQRVLDLRGLQIREILFGEARNANPSVRAAATRALAKLAGEGEIPDLAELLFAATDNEDTVNLQKAIAEASLRNPDKEKRAAAVLALLAEAQGARRSALLRVLPKIGGGAALAALVAETASKDAQVQGVAIYALSKWPDPQALDELLKIIGAPVTKKNLLTAVDGYVRIVGKAPYPAYRKRGLLKNLLTIVKDEADKRAVLAGLAEIRDPESLRILGGFLNSPVLGAEALGHVLEMASEQAPEERWLSGELAISVLRRAEAAASDPADRDRAARIIADRLKQGGYVALFNGRDLDGWKGLVADPPKRAKMTAEELAKAQAEADAGMRAHWRVADGVLVFDGKGESLCSTKDYGDFEMLVDWKIEKAGDSGIYLRGSPQVQIWDPAANPVGSGGLYNNQKGPSKPLAVADRPVGEWNTFRIVMIGDRVTVYLNDKMVVDNTVLENYWERDKPIYPTGQLELQAHGNVLYFRNVYVREIPRDPAPAGAAAPYAVSEAEKDEGFVPLFNGIDLAGWTGDTKGYAADNGKIVIYPERGSGNLYTEKEFGDFVFRFEFKLTPAANNGVGIRAPLAGDAAYAGMEIQILEDGSPVYWDLQPYQFHGSIYGVVPARRGVLRAVGEWNSEEITARGRRVTVRVNGTTVVDADLDQASAGGTIDHNAHPGLARTSGHIGFLGHGAIVEFRNIRIRELK
jgi:HEAT repeat protein